MRLDDACKMMQGIVDGLYTAEQLLYALDPPKEWREKDQKLLSTHEIRQLWFAENMSGASIGVNIPQWKECENVRRLGLTPRSSKHTEPSLYDILIGRLARKGIHIHYRPTMEKTYVPQQEQLNDIPELSNKELGHVKARIKREQKKNRKLIVAEKMAAQPNATTREIERLAFMTMYLSM